MVQTEDIYEAEERYSSHLLAELSDELHKQRPELDDLLDSLRELGRMAFTIGEWTETARRRTPGLTDAEAKEQLAILYDASVVGGTRIGGSGGGSQHVFNYAAQHAKLDFGGRMHVHPGLKKGLQLKERQAADTEADEEVEMDSAS